MRLVSAALFAQLVACTLSLPVPRQDREVPHADPQVPVPLAEITDVRKLSPQSKEAVVKVRTWYKTPLRISLLLCDALQFRRYVPKFTKNLVPPCTLKSYSLQWQPEISIVSSFSVHPLWEKVLLGNLINADLVKKFLSSLLNVMYYYQEPYEGKPTPFLEPGTSWSC